MTAERTPATTASAVRTGLFYGWWIAGACVAVNFFLSIGFYQGFQAFFLPIEREFGWTRTQMSGAFSLRQFESGLMSPLVGFLCDRFTPRVVIVGCVLATGLGVVMLAATNDLLWFYLAFVVASSGASGASHSVSWAIVIANWFRRLRGRAMGLAFLGPVIGGPCTIFVVMLEEAVGWRTALLLLGVLLWVTCIPLGWMARTAPEPYGLRPDGDPPAPAPAPRPAVAAVAAPAPAATDGGLTTKQALRSPAFWLLALLFGAHSLGTSGINVHVLPLFESLGFDARSGALVLGMVFLFSGIGRVAAGALMDAFDARKVLIGIFAVQVVVFVFMPLMGHEWWQAIVFTLVFGATFGSTVPARPLLIRQFFGPRSFGAVNGLAQGVAIVPAMVGPVMMGASFDAFHSYTPAIMAFAAITALMVPVPLLLRKADAG